jgi:hypothetical protein
LQFWLHAASPETFGYTLIYYKVKKEQPMLFLPIYHLQTAMPCFINIWIILKIRETSSTFGFAHVSSGNAYWQVTEAPYITCEESNQIT